MPAPLLERAVTSLRLRALDLRDRVAGRGDPLVPPRRLHFVGHADSDFAGTGEEFLGHFVALGGLRASDRVLDIGSGIGRMARPLAGFLDAGAGGAYDGFDVNRDGIVWCREHYEAAGHDNFAFVVADIFNTHYNPAGTQDAAAFTFPYDDGTFDFALATSVFTHLVETAAARYVAEAARVLREGGTLFATWLLLDDASRDAVRAGRAALPFRIGPPGSAETSAVIDPAVPEDAIAFDRGWLQDLYTRNGLAMTAIHDGTWRGSSGPTYQDVVVATKGTPTP